MINTVSPSTNSNVVVVTAPGPSGPIGPAGPIGEPGTITTNSGTIVSPYLIVNGTATITGSLIVSGSGTFYNIGPAQFSGSTGMLGNLTVNGTATATTFSGSGALLTGIPASGITGLNLSRIADSTVSASVSTGATAFTLNTGGTTLFTVNNSGLGTFTNGLTVNGAVANLNAGLNVSTGNTVINSPTIQLIGTATLNGQPITTAGDLTLDKIKSGAVTASVSTGATAFTVETGGTDLFTVSNAGLASGSFEGSGAGLTGIPASGIVGLNLSQIASGSVSASISPNDGFKVNTNSEIVGSLSVTGGVSGSFSGSFQGDGSNLTGLGIIYNSGSNPLISSIQVADFDNNVAVTYVDGNLKFIFGTPTPPSSPSISLSGFATDRFNKVSDSYNTVASWDVGGYTLVSAKLYYTVTGQLLDSTTSGTSFNVVQASTGSGQAYKVEVTSSSPLDGSISQQSSTVTGNLSKSRPNVPTISITGNTVQLGIGSNQIEEGASGDISFSAAYGSANSWEEVSLTTTPSSSPQTVSTPTGTVSISATSNYQSPAGDNDPQVFDNRTTTTTYSRIKSLRYGASVSTAFTEGDLQTLADWDTGLGGTVGTIRKGTVNPSGQSVTITWSSDKYHYIVMSSAYTLSNITTGGFGVFSAFDATVVGGYRVYRTKTLQAGGAGTSITYVLST